MGIRNDRTPLYEYEKELPPEEIKENVAKNIIQVATGFMPSPEEYEKMLKEREYIQERLDQIE